MAGTATISWIYPTYFDTDAQALFDAAQITDATVKSAVNTLIISAKANGWWTLCNAIWGMAGDNVSQTYASQYKYNWKDPRDLDAAFRLTFFNNPTFTTNGIDWDGSSQFASTHLNPSTVLSSTSNHLSYYSREDIEASVVTDIGANDSGTKFMILCCGRSLDNISFYEQGSAYTPATNSGVSTAAYFLGTRTAVGSPNLFIYRNGTDLGATYTSDGGDTALPNIDLYLGGYNLNNGLGQPSNRQCAFATVGAAINSTIQALMYSDIQTYQTTLGRQV